MPYSLRERRRADDASVLVGRAQADGAPILVSRVSSTHAFAAGCAPIQIVRSTWHVPWSRASNLDLAHFAGRELDVDGRHGTDRTGTSIRNS